MPYEPQTWADGESGETPITADRLNYIEQGILDASETETVISWDAVEDKPAVIAAGTSQEEARNAIGAGTSDLEIGTTATTAKAGNYAPTWAQVSGKPTLGDLATRDTVANAQVDSGIAATKITVTAEAESGLEAGDLQAVLEALAYRIANLEA